MPILSINFGESSFSYLYIDDKNDQVYWNYPYAYQKTLYSHFCSSDQYYTELVNYIATKHKLSLSKTSIITTGLNIPSTIGRNVALSLPVQNLLSKYNAYNLLYIDNSNIFTQNNLISDITDIDNFISPRERDFMINYNYYKRITPTNLSQYDAILNKIYKVIVSNQKLQEDMLVSGKDLLIINSHYFPSKQEYEIMFYFYLITSIINKGISKIKFADNDKLIHYILLSEYSGDYKYLIDEFTPISLGTLANYPTNITCLIKSQLGSQQLVEMKPGQLFFLPLDLDSTININIQAGSDIIEKDVYGGKLGFVIDTRDKTFANYNYDLLRRDMELNQKNLQEAFSRI